MMRHVILMFGVQALLLGSARQASADFIVNQPSSFPVSGSVGVWLSQFDPPADGGLGPLGRMYDNFTLSNGAVVTRVTWQGGYYGPPQAGNIISFELTLWSQDSMGGPGTQLATRLVTGNANETSVGSELGTGATAADGNLVFNYSANIAPLSLAAGFNYWFSIVADLDYNNVPLDPIGNPTVGAWGWHTAKDGFGDGASVQDYYTSATTYDRSVINNDLAFTLEGTVVPEPPSIMLFCSGTLISLAWYACRRRKLRNLLSQLGVRQTAGSEIECLV
jgi:hypothetical protein